MIQEIPQNVIAAPDNAQVSAEPTAQTVQTVQPVQPAPAQPAQTVQQSPATTDVQAQLDALRVDMFATNHNYSEPQKNILKEHTDIYARAGYSHADALQKAKTLVESTHIKSNINTQTMHSAGMPSQYTPTQEAKAPVYHDLASAKIHWAKLADVCYEHLKTKPAEELDRINPRTNGTNREAYTSMGANLMEMVNKADEKFVQMTMRKPSAKTDIAISKDASFNQFRRLADKTSHNRWRSY